MAHKKTGGSKAYQGKRTAGKRLGIKIGGGQPVKTGQIIVRQRGSVYHPGEGVGMGRDFTIFAKRNGNVAFKNKNRNKKEVLVVDLGDRS